MKIITRTKIMGMTIYKKKLDDLTIEDISKISYDSLRNYDFLEPDNSITIDYDLIKKDLDKREVYLYDTFEGYLGTSKEDFQIQDGKSPQELYKGDSNYLCSAELHDVQSGVEASGYPLDLVTYVVGDVLKTIPDILPKSIALLRLDTDYFDSTLHELKHLFPLVTPGGVIIIDDYDHWNGSKKACDDYFKSINEEVLLMRMEAGRMLIKRGR